MNCLGSEKSRSSLFNLIVKMKIYIVGSGKLANAIFTSNLSFRSCEITRWDKSYIASNEKSIIVHAGLGMQIKECLEFCSLRIT